jgi:hypothetical protein
MAIVLLAIIGAKIGAGTAYWICFGVWCAIRVGRAVKEATDNG